ncbi:ankyrin repeat-containing domain protein [Aspergillus unguis]
MSIMSIPPVLRTFRLRDNYNMNTNSPILQLPEELILIIAEYLSHDGLKAFSQTIKCSRRIALPLLEKQRKFKDHCVLLWGDSIYQVEPFRYPNGTVPEYQAGIDQSTVDNKILERYNALLSACEEGDISAARALLERKTSPNPPGTGNWYTPIEAAARSNHLDIVELLLASGADLKRLTFADKYRLVCGENSASQKTIEALVSSGLDLRTTDTFDRNLLHSVAHGLASLGESAPSLIQRLLDLGLDTEQFDDTDQTPLAAAITSCPADVADESPELEAIKLLLRARQGVDVPCDANGNGPLRVACINGKATIAKLLMTKYHASIRAQPGPGGAENMLEISLVPPFDLAVLRVVFDAWFGSFAFYRPNVLFFAAAVLNDIRMLQLLRPLSTPDEDTNTNGFSKEMALLEAARLKNEEAVAFLLPHVASVTSPNFSGWTALRWAPEFSEKTCRAVFARATQAEIDEHAEVLLCSAALYSSDRIVSFVLERITVLPSGDSMSNVLESVASNGRLEMLQQLLTLSQQQGYTIPDKSLHSALSRAVIKGHTDVVKALLAHSHINIEATNSDTNTALALAVLKNQPEIVQFLIDAGADVTVRLKSPRFLFGGSQTAEALAAHAAEMQYDQVLRILLAAKADPNAVDWYYGRSVLMWACLAGYSSIAKALVHEYGADIHKRDNSGITALSHAAAIGNAEIVKLLLDSGAQTDAVAVDGSTPLFLTCANQPLPAHSSIGRMVISRGEPIPSQDPANLENRLEATRLLLAAGANAHHSDASGRTAFSHAAGSGLEQFVRFFLAVGVDIDEVDSDGRTALSWAAEHALPGTVRILVEAGADVF